MFSAADKFLSALIFALPFRPANAQWRRDDLPTWFRKAGPISE
jgi:hypothetical protein